MHIKSISAANFRKFVEPVSIAGLRPGLNIIAGDNEAGKSTIVAAIKAALYKKYSSTTASELQPYNSSVTPEVELEFELMEVDYRLRKSFGKKGACDLRSAQGAFSGSQAEEKLRQLLLLGDEKKSNTSIWNALLVEQGTSFETPSVGEVGAATLQTALENEVGKIAANNNDHCLVKRITDLYSQWYTDGGKHKVSSDYKKEEKQLLALTAEYEKKQFEYESYKSILDELATTAALLDAHEQKQTLKEAQTQVESACATLEAISKDKDSLDKLCAITQAAKAEYEKTSQIWQIRHQAIENLQRQQEVQAGHKQKLQSLTESFDERARNLHVRQQEEETAKQSLAECESKHKRLEIIAEFSKIEAAVKEASQRLQSANTAGKNASALKQKAELLKCDRQSIVELEELEKQLLQFEAKLQAVATKIEFRPSARNRVTIAGADVPADTAQLVTSFTEIELEGFGGIAVTPGGDGIEQLRARAAAAKKSFTAMLTTLNVDSVAEAQAQEREKLALLQQWNENLRDVTRYAPAGIAAAEEELCRLTQRHQELKDVVADCREDDLADIMSQLSALKRDREKKGQLAKDCSARMIESDKQVTQLGNEIKVVTAELNSVSKNIDLLTEKLKTLRTEISDDKLSQMVMETKAALEKSQQAESALKAQIGAHSIAEASAKVEQAKEKLQTLQKSIQQFREKRSQLAGSLQTFGRAGIAEEFQSAKDKKEQVEQRLARLAKKAAAVKLLHDTIKGCEAASKSSLMEPLLHHLEPYLNDVFTSGHLIVDTEHFGITHLKRSNQEETYSSLSLGTREQVSVLTRLAFAHVLAENNRPSVLVLDDVLVYSDEARFAKMKQALARGSRSFQILVLTCRPRDWSDIGAPTFSITERCPEPAIALDRLQVQNYVHPS